jgi:hypothetical protein
MATKATLWTYLQLLSFSNTGLFYNGFYRVKIAIQYRNSSGREVKAVPIYCQQFTAYLDKRGIVAEEGDIDRESGEYESAAIMIRSALDEVRLNDICCFEGIVECDQGVKSNSIAMTISLSHGYGRDRDSAAVRLPSDEDQPPLPITLLSIDNPLQGVHEHRPVTFKDQYSSVLGMIVHTYAVQWELSESLCRELPTAEDQRQRELRAEFDAWISPIVGNLEELQSTVADIQPHIGNFAEIVTLSQEIYKTGTLPRDHLLATYWNDFCLRCQSTTPAETLEVIRSLVTYATYYVAELMTALLALSSFHTSTVLLYYQEKAQKYRSLLYNHAIQIETNRVDTLPLTSPADLGNRHKALAAARRLEPLPIPISPISQQDLPDIDVSNFPVLFVDSYKRTNAAEDQEEPRSGFHLMVFVNGFGGSRGDLLIIKDFIARSYSHNMDFLLSQANQGDDTKEDIFEMGRKLAAEVEAYMGEDIDLIERLSFIGYSLGGLIIRAALCYMEKFKGKMFTVVTLSSPHLGLMYASSVLVEAGVWVWTSLTQAPSLKQISMSDASVVKGTALYQLSEHPGLEWFQHVVLFSSADDYYSPIESSRIELSEKAVNGSEKGCYFVEMAGRLLSNLQPERLLRVNVDFVLPTSLDHIVGRKAHLEFVKNEQFVLIFVEKFPELFL